jgi:hypothetical protein
MIVWTHCFGPETRQNIMAKSTWQRKDAQLKERERKGTETRYTL